MFFNKKIKKAVASTEKFSQLDKLNKGDLEGIIVLGSGCANCEKLEENVKNAMSEIGIKEDVKHIKDFSKIVSYGVMSTPALVVDGKVVSSGRVLSSKDVKKILEERVK